MASGTGEWQGNWMKATNSGAYRFVKVDSTSFNASTGVTTVNWHVGTYVSYGNFYGSNVTSWGSCSHSYALYDCAIYDCHYATTTVAYDNNIHWIEGCGYNSSSQGGWIQSALDVYWYPTLPTYTVSYNANGGSGAPASQSGKWGATVTLSSTAPTRTGYTFGGWNTKADGTGTNYAKGGKLTTKANVTLYAKWTINTYSVQYANGGHGTAPAAQTKTYGTALTLRPSMGTVSNYKFKDWKATNGTTYNGGGSYTANAATTMTAEWYAPYTVSYNANGGSGAPSSQVKVYGGSVNISSTVPTRTNYNFIEWNTNSSGTGTKYTAGQAYSTNANLTLYAIWEIAHSNPTISNLLVQRCLQDGTLADDGEYCKVSATVSVDNSTEGYTDTKLKTVTVQVGSNAAESVTVDTTATSANISFISSNQVSLTSTYAVKLTVTDSHDFSSYKTSNLSVAYFTMHFKEGGHGIAIGKKSVTDNLFDVNMNTKVTGTLDTTGKITSLGNVQAQCYLILRANADRYSAIRTIPGDNNASGRSADAIKFYGTQDNADGDEIVIGNGGQVIVGSGESATSLHTALNVSPGTEQTYITSDNSIFLCTKANTIGNRVQWLFAANNYPTIYGTCGAENAVSVGTSSNNGVTANTTIGAYVMRDKNEYWTLNLGSRTDTANNSILTYLGARNQKTDGTDITNYINIIVDKNGTQRYGVSSPTNFRSAISAATKTWTSLGSCKFNSDSSGTTKVTYDLTNYSEVLFVAKCTTANDHTSNSYGGSCLLPKAILNTTTCEYVLTGGSIGGSDTGGNRYFSVRATTTQAIPIAAYVDYVNRYSTSTLYVYAR